MLIKTDVLTISDAISLFWSSLVFLFGRHFLLVVLLVCFGKGASDCVMAMTSRKVLIPDLNRPPDTFLLSDYADTYRYYSKGNI